jgi:hypothetical protein
MAVGWVRWLGVFKAHLLDYIVFYLTLTTENCFNSDDTPLGTLEGEKQH